MRERFHLKAWPLTPIHVGDGEELTPENWTLAGDSLRRFQPFLALAAASDPQRTLYLQKLKGGDYVGAQKLLADLAVENGLLESAGVRVAPASRADMDRVLNGAGAAKLAVRALTRSGETAILPGSSIKGAIRTAWTQKAMLGKDHRTLLTAVQGTRTTRAAKQVPVVAFGMKSAGNLDQDPFRDLAVADATVLPGTTRFDRATLGKLSRDNKAELDFSATGGIQMHVECCESLADGGVVSPMDVFVDLLPSDQFQTRGRSGQRRDVRNNSTRQVTPAVSIPALDLWAAINSFHADLWNYEKARFYGTATSAGPLLERLLAAFGLSSGPNLSAQLTQKHLILLRIGRYSQFESKSLILNGERHGMKAGTRGIPPRLMDAGGTRTTVRVAGNRNAPFGWLILSLVGSGPTDPIKADLSGLIATAQPLAPALGARGAPPPPPQATSALATTFRFRKGDRVIHPEQGDAVVHRDVGVNETKMEINFDGDIETWPVSGWTKRL